MTEEHYQLPLDFVPITLQRIFDAAWQAFIVEGKPPAQEIGDNGWVCRYLTVDGRRCSVGLLIPQGHPAQTSLKNACDLFGEYPELFAYGEKPDSFSRLQSALHDLLCENGKWKVEDICTQYCHVASEYGLTIPGERQ